MTSQKISSDIIYNYSISNLKNIMDIKKYFMVQNIFFQKYSKRFYKGISKIF